MEKPMVILPEHGISEETIAVFLRRMEENGADENDIRRYRRALQTLYEDLPDDKRLTRQALLEWRRHMQEKGYAAVTIDNYVKSINHYLDASGCAGLRFNRGHAKDIRGRSFGYLTAIAPTNERNRGDIVWLCQCRCGNQIKLPATRLLRANTLSCGCRKGSNLRRINKSIENTNLRQALDDRVISTKSASGYVGVTAKRGKWQAYITYKGIHYSLGCYDDLQEAVKARARAKQLVIEDAQNLLSSYEALHQQD